MAAREAAFETFKAEFVCNGFPVPNGLIRLLEYFQIKPAESAEKCRARLYKYLWCLLWHGSGKTLGASVGCQPTYVFPSSLKRVVREIIPGNLVERPDPTHSGVYLVNIDDLASAKWPAAKPKGRQSN